ncbi:FGGY-family carbohydrate kinase [Actinophytocola sp.]|uniref:FGGY-family carbohydrate kinase n=1 Tax=Actinophytocola sp. TaxID=1872138 RepID=UPI002ED21AC0
MTTDAVVGVDIGTTETKALVIGTDGRELGFARDRTTWHGPETTADALLADALVAIDAALTAAETATGQRVRAIGLGLAGFAESGVVLDGAGRVVSPVIAWYDQRGAAELAALDPVFREEFPRRTGLPVGPQWTIGKLLWRSDPLPPGACWLNIPEYVAHSLGAARVSEPSLASRTGLLDQATGKQWPEALALLGVGSLLPDSLPAGHSAGVVAQRPGVPAGLVGAAITVVGHDHPVAATGVGATGDHELFNSCGTADVLLRSVPRPLTDDERETLVGRGIDAGRHVLDGQSVLIGGIRAGLVMRRVLAMLGADDPSGRARLDMLTGDPRRVTVSGARSTDEDVTVTLSDGASPAAVWSATLAHISEVTESLLRGVNDVVGVHRAAVAAGGWTRMTSVREAKRRLLPELRFSSLAQPGAFGAALFAAWAAAGNPGEFLSFADPLRRAALEPPIQGVTHDTPGTNPRGSQPHLRGT